MNEGFDLRDQPWIPVRLTTGGAVRRVGLRELFKQAHEIGDLEIPVPPAASGLLRILVAMASRIAQVDGQQLGDADVAEDLDGWFELRQQILEQGRFDPAMVDTYLDVQVPAGHLDLFDARRPFLQDPRLDAECLGAKGEPNPSGVNKLVLGRPTGENGAVLFGHFTDGDPVPVPAQDAVLHLIAQLYYGPAGQCTPRRITKVKPGNGDAGPLRKTVSFHPWAPQLFTTLLLGVPRPLDTDTELTDQCPWETQALPDPLRPLPPVTWPGRVLTGRARHAVLLVPSNDFTTVTDAYVTWSTHEPAPSARDPYVILDMPKAGGEPYARPADGQRAVWRDVDALLLSGNTATQRPSVFDDIAGEVPRSVLNALKVRAYGFHQDGQQKDTSWYEATTPPVLRWLQEAEPAMALHLGRCRQAADDIGDRLHFAARLAWKLTTDTNADPSAKVKLDAKKPGPWAAAAARAYWPMAERIFWDLAVPERCDEPPHRLLADAALEALDAALGAARADLRTARARSRARAIIHSTVPAQKQTPAIISGGLS
ncbi:type I-E CRISPR-associated protein Cse1/CasA [Streptomyces sp. NPDC020681]|uniref:type I-E CRISPR-associated protein Cse1/CasA n=1 Tax=Streptomyces sp. NPDC020681 TaxID=3365083 RepID=UPI00379B4350